MADNIWTAAVEGIAARGRANNGAEGDYRDEEGFLCCGKCHTRKEGDITIGEKTLRVPHLCKCESEADSVKPKKRPPNSGSNANDFAKTGSLIRRTCPRTSPRTTTAMPEFPTCAAAMWNTGRK